MIALARRLRQHLWLTRMRIRAWWNMPAMTEIAASIEEDRRRHRRGVRSKIIRRQREMTAALRGDRSAA